MFLLYLIHL